MVTIYVVIRIPCGEKKATMFKSEKLYGDKLLTLLARLVDNGNKMIMIDYNMELINTKILAQENH